MEHTFPVYLVSRLIFKNGGKIFGGYIRDTLSGREPSDIDVLFSDLESVQRFFFDLGQCLFLKIEKVDVDYLYCQYHFRIISEAFGRINHIDVICGDPFSNQADADVNLLLLGGDGLCVWKSRFDLLKVLGRIQRKEFLCLDRCPAKRRKKMIQMGWTEVKR